MEFIFGLKYYRIRERQCSYCVKILKSAELNPLKGYHQEWSLSTVVPWGPPTVVQKQKQRKNITKGHFGAGQATI